MNKKIFVEYLDHRSTYTETVIKEVSERDIDIALFHCPEWAIAFRFYDMVQEEPVINNNKITFFKQKRENIGPYIFINGKFYSEEEIEIHFPQEEVPSGNDLDRKFVQSRFGKIHLCEPTDMVYKT